MNRRWMVVLVDHLTALSTVNLLEHHIVLVKLLNDWMSKLAQPVECLVLTDLLYEASDHVLSKTDKVSVKDVSLYQVQAHTKEEHHEFVEHAVNNPGS